MTSLHEHFNDFIEARLAAGHEAFNHNEGYSKALAFLKQCPQHVYNQAMTLYSIGEQVAYRLGFQDGLIFMAENKH